MKPYTNGDAYAITILAAEKMGLNPMFVDEAKRLLAGGAIHPMTGAAMSKESVEMNNRLRHDATLIAKANVYAEELKVQHGFMASSANS